MGERAQQLYVLSNTPGAIYQDLLIIGTRLSEGPGPSAPGHIRAFDVRSGRLRWVFKTIPHPGEFGYDTWPADAWTHIGGANAWSGISVDTTRGLVFLPTGSAAFDFWGGNRHGQNLFANSLLVLNAATGQRVWHYQFVHHDLWDRDLPSAPVLVTVTHEGRQSRCRRADDQVRPRVPVQPRDRRAAVSHRRARGAALGPQGRSGVAHTAAAGEATRLLTPGVHRGRCHRRLRARRARRSWPSCGKCAAAGSSCRPARRAP